MQEVTELGLRERKKLATREALASATRDLVLEYGFDAVTVEMVSEAVGVSVRTFFNYYDSKESAVIGAARDDVIGEPEARAAFVAGGPTGVLVDDLLDLIFPAEALQRAGRDEVRTLIGIAELEPRVMAAQLGRFARHERDIGELVAARCGLPTDSSRAQTVVAVAFTLMRRAFTEWIHSEGEGADRFVAQARDDAATLFRTT